MGKGGVEKPQLQAARHHLHRPPSFPLLPEERIASLPPPCQPQNPSEAPSPNQSSSGSPAVWPFPSRAHHPQILTSRHREPLGTPEVTVDLCQPNVHHPGQRKSCSNPKVQLNSHPALGGLPKHPTDWANLARPPPPTNYSSQYNAGMAKLVACGMLCNLWVQVFSNSCQHLKT